MQTRKAGGAGLVAADRTCRGKQSTEKVWDLGSNWFCCGLHGLSINHDKSAKLHKERWCLCYHDSSMVSTEPAVGFDIFRRNKAGNSSQYQM